MITPPSGGNSNENPWNHFLNPRYRESENLQNAREYMNENSLPLSYSNDNDNPIASSKEESIEDKTASLSSASSMVLSSSNANEENAGGNKVLVTAEQLANNPYISVVSKLTPSEMISKFISTADSRVQNAVRTTILGMIGNLPQLAFETTSITTGQALASLMFQLQMTGYMFKNAEYRLSLQQSLGIAELNDQQMMITDQFSLSNGNGNKSYDHLDGKVRGKIRVKYTASNDHRSSQDEMNDESIETGSRRRFNNDIGTIVDVEVDANAYFAELRKEVQKLRDEFAIVRKAEEDKLLKQDLLTYLRTLPPQELQSLTNTMSQDVLIAMKGLVHAVISGIGNNPDEFSYKSSKQQQETIVSPTTLIEQSTEALAQLCMWQLVTGYNLRTLEVREEMKQSLLKSISESNSGDDDGSIGILQ